VRSQFLPCERDPHAQRLLVTSNDSRIRMYDGYALSCKYKGLKNLNGQIRASFGPDGAFIVCGSEDSRVYIWCVVLFAHTRIVSRTVKERVACVNMCVVGESAACVVGCGVRRVKTVAPIRSGGIGLVGFSLRALGASERRRGTCDG